MQKPDSQKRREIQAAAARLFAERPYHEVKLEDVAAAAKVGKGTLYVYFAGKEQLYVAVVAEGFARLVDDVIRRVAAASDSAWQSLAAVVDGLLAFSRRYPHLFSLLRSGHPVGASAELAAERARLAAVIEGVLREGIAAGEIDDPHPELTAHFVPALVRAVLLYGPADAHHDVVAEHIVRVLRRGLRTEST